MKQPDLKKVNPKVVAKWCAHYKLEVDPEKDLKAAVAALSHQMKDAPKIAGCDSPGCGGDSDISLPECPFCGDVEIQGTSELPEEGEPTKPVTEVTTEVQDMTVKKTAKKAVAKKTAKKAVAKKVPVKKAVAKKVPVKKPAAKKPIAKKVPVKKSAAKKAPVKKAVAKKAEIVPVGESSITVSKALETGIDEVKKVQLAGVMCTWELGKALLNIYEKKLYTQMVDGQTGKPLYDSWTKFCKKVLGIDQRYGYRLMDVAAHFTKAQVAEIGVTKLTMIVRVPEEKRAELMKDAKNTPKSKVAKEVQRLAGNSVRDTGRTGFTGTRGNGPKKAIKKSDKLTVIRSQPRVVVDLFKRGTTDRAVDIDDAVGIEQCANGKTVHYAFLETEEGLALVVETRQE